MANLVYFLLFIFIFFPIILIYLSIILLFISNRLFLLSLTRICFTNLNNYYFITSRTTAAIYVNFYCNQFLVLELSVTEIQYLGFVSPTSEVGCLYPR